MKINNAAMKRRDKWWVGVSDEEVVEAFAGKRIKFINRMSGKVDKAKLPAHDARYLACTRYVTSAGRKVRALEFVDPSINGGFRVIRLRQIVNAK